MIVDHRFECALVETLIGGGRLLAVIRIDPHLVVPAARGARGTHDPSDRSVDLPKRPLGHG
jgi:hypothetical protein